MVTEKKQVFLGTGRRKEAVARVRLTPGSGKIIVNERDFQDYFSKLDSYYNAVLAPLKATETQDRVDIRGLANGGGLAGQASAMSLGIARALIKLDESLRPALKAGGFLTRDSRMKERKKPGRPGARKRFQFSKR